MGVDVTGQTPAVELPSREGTGRRHRLRDHPRALRVAEPHHGAALFELIEEVMADWERRKQRVERAMA